MADWKDNGGSAFPIIPPVHPSGGTSAEGYPYPENGLTKREWFAGMAIGAVIKQCCSDRADVLEGRSIEQYFAEKAFAIADAMLKAGEA